MGWLGWFGSSASVEPRELNCVNESNVCVTDWDSSFRDQLENRLWVEGGRHEAMRELDKERGTMM